MWKTFDVSERVDVMFSRARREEIERHNDEVRQNRGMLRTLSEAVLYLSRQELPFHSCYVLLLTRTSSQLKISHSTSPETEFEEIGYFHDSITTR